MMSYCLTDSELEILLVSFLNGNTIVDGSLSEIISNAECYQDNLIGVTYLLARIVERQNNHNTNKALISKLYSLPNELSFEIQESDDCFIRHMLLYGPYGETDIEGIITEASRRISEHTYEKK